MLPSTTLAEDQNEDEAAAGQVKKRPKLDRRVDQWDWFKFDNPARNDEFKLCHWVKVKEQNEPYQFARFNRKLEVISYTDEEYKKAVDSVNSTSSNVLQQWCDWTKLETDVLFDLCERFQLRFIVIADRFQQEL